MVPPRNTSSNKASSVKRIKTIRLGYVVDAATFDIMDIMALMVFSTGLCACTSIPTYLEKDWKIKI